MKERIKLYDLKAPSYVMQVMRRMLLPLALLFFSRSLSAQSQNPSSLKYSNISTPHFSVIVPDNALSQGIKTANILEVAYRPDAQSFKTYPAKTKVVLFNQTTISNGYTALAPRHIGLYTTPPQNAAIVGGTDWLETLVIHEYRHAAQFNKLDTNFNAFAGRVFGDYGKLVSMYIAVPFWVFEGDAVCNETMYTREGRGRLPSFTRDIYALESERIRYSYQKAYLGSYKNYFPDHYHLGYLMCSHLRKNYGIEKMNNIIDFSTQYPFNPFIFSKSLKRNTSYRMMATYENCLNEFDALVVDKKNPFKTSGFTKVSPENPRAYTNYSYPFFIDSEKILALKNGFNDSPTLVIIEKNTERKLVELNPTDRIHSNGETVVWASEYADIRWGMRSYSNILVYTISTGKLRSLTNGGKYFAPAISPDGSKIAAIKYGDDMKCSLVILNTSSGYEEKSHLFEADEFARMPSWSPDGKKIIFTVTSGQQRNISVYNLNDQTIKIVVPDSYESISNPLFYKSYVIFNSPAAAIDAVHAYDTLTGERYVISMGNYGVYNPAISTDESKIAIENYTTAGMEIASLEMDQREWQHIPVAKKEHASYNDYLIKQEGAVSIFDSVDIANQSGYEIKKYRPLLHTINIHSWAPYPVSNGIEFTVYSADVLNTTLIDAGVTYFAHDDAVQEFINLSYAKFFPVIDIGFSNGRKYDTFADSVGEPYTNKMDEKVFSTGISLPLNFSRHIYSTSLILGTKYNYLSYKFIDPDTNRYHVSAMEYTLKFSRSKQMTRRDINPKFGQELNLTYWQSILNSDVDGNRLVASATVYLPGLANHHSLTLSGGFQKNSPLFRRNIYQLTSDLERIRGYEHENSDRFIRGTIDYTMPLMYPDLALGSIFYLKRISTNLFYDHGFIETDTEDTIHNSVGIDLNFDFHLFNFMPVPITMGIRYSLRLLDNSSTFELLLFRLPVS